MWRASVPPVKPMTMMMTPPIADGRYASRFSVQRLEQRAAQNSQGAGGEDEQDDPEHDRRDRAARGPRERLGAPGRARHEAREQPVHAFERAAHEAAEEDREQPADREDGEGGEHDGQVGHETRERVAEHGDELRSPFLQSFHASSESGVVSAAAALTVADGAILLD